MFSTPFGIYIYMQLALQSHLSLDSKKSRQVLGKVLHRVQASWNFTNVEMALLLRVKPNTYGHWMKKHEIPFQKPPYSSEIEILIALLSIFRSLGSMFTSFSDQILWLKTPHPHFAGKSPLEFAKNSCENIFYLKQYLDFVRGRGA